jgi:phosphohistidine phosphatase
MNLYLVQHAAAKPEQEDPSRPLSEKGFADIQKVAALLGRMQAIRVSAIMHSGKTRALQTAQVIAQALKTQAPPQTTDGLAPLDSPAIWAGRLAQQENDLMLVGHLPHLAKLAGLLLTGSDSGAPVEFQMGGVICLRRDAAGAWSVAWMIVPEILP